MKKAIVVGGGSGIGLAVSKKLMSYNYRVIIVDLTKPSEGEFVENEDYEYINTDLNDFDDALFERLSSDAEAEVLMVTAGFGRVAAFEYLHQAEIRKLMQVNTTAGIMIVKAFYHRINSSAPFYCGMMGSIAGLVSSPLFSVYAASKAAICRFIESVNIELEATGLPNRILNVSPASIAGTKFNGGANDLAKISDLATTITEKLLASETLYIPQYDEFFEGVIEHYQADPHEYGMHSYQYKMESGRIFNGKHVKIGYLSGTFDLFHVGHLNLLKRAKSQCDYLIVGVHESGAWKGKETFVSFEERKDIVGACKYVDKVVQSCREDSEAWDKWHYNKLFVGSDYKGTERFNRYEEYFKDKGVEIVYFPYTKGTSSTEIRKAMRLKTKDM